MALPFASTGIGEHDGNENALCSPVEKSRASARSAYAHCQIATGGPAGAELSKYRPLTAKRKTRFGRQDASLAPFLPARPEGSGNARKERRPVSAPRLPQFAIQSPLRPAGACGQREPFLGMDFFQPVQPGRSRTPHAGDAHFLPGALVTRVSFGLRQDRGSSARQTVEEEAAGPPRSRNSRSIAGRQSMGRRARGSALRLRRRSDEWYGATRRRGWPGDGKRPGAICPKRRPD